MIAISRQDFDSLINPMIDRAYGPGAAKVVEQSYPKGTSEAVIECHMRGVEATAGRIEYFAKLSTSKLRIIGKQRVWYRSDIDALVAYLEEHGAYTTAAQNARMFGRTLADNLTDTWTRVTWLRGIGHIQPRDSMLWITTHYEHIRCLKEMLAKPDLSTFYGGDAAARELFDDDRRGLLVELVCGDRDDGIPLPNFIRNEIETECRKYFGGELPCVLPGHGKNKSS